jgi:23S rRNA (cytidine1920-2'-O)/16S rRNA (cytidine1409-2'-O)-methyltransferase
MRLDLYLKQQLNVASRNQAREYIKSHFVSIDGSIITKPSFNVVRQKVCLLQKNIFVSRAGYKLKYFLDDIKDINICLKNANVLDIGASKGGFTQALLSYDIAKIICVDVGSAQLDESIKANKKVQYFENTDIRDFKSNIFFNLIVCDVSFISLDKIIKYIDDIKFKQIILLFKPQFEVGKNAKRNKKGVVIDLLKIQKAKESFLNLTTKFNWKCIKSAISKKSGKNGSIEEFFYFEKQ